MDIQVGRLCSSHISIYRIYVRCIEYIECWTGKQKKALMALHNSLKRIDRIDAYTFPSNASCLAWFKPKVQNQQQEKCFVEHEPAAFHLFQHNIRFTATMFDVQTLHMPSTKVPNQLRHSILSIIIPRFNHLTFTA